MKNELISFTGNGRTVGKQYGNLVRPFLEKALKLIPQSALDAFTKPEVLSKAEYLKKYLKALETWMPYCLDELHGMAEAFDQPFEDIVLWNSCRYAPADIDNCTSWIIMPDVSEYESIILHKNRDGGGAYQSFLMKKVDKNLKWFGPVDIPGTSPLFGINEKGVAVAMNNGEPCEENNPVGLTTPDILRLLMDKAHCANEAFEIFKEIVTKGAYAHHKNGSIFMIVDAQKAFIAENTAKKCFVEEIKEGFAVRSNDWRIPEIKKYSIPCLPRRMASDRSRYNRVTEMLESFLQTKKIGIKECQIIGKDRVNAEDPEKGSAIAKASTSFAITAVPSKEQSDLFSKVAVTMGHPTSSCAIPFYFGAHGVPEILADSRYTQKSYELCQKFGFDSIEKIGLLNKEDRWIESFSEIIKNIKLSSRHKNTKDNIKKNLNKSFYNLTQNALQYLTDLGNE